MNLSNPSRTDIPAARASDRKSHTWTDRGTRVAALRIHVALRPGHKEAACLLQPVQALEIDVATIHDMEGARLRNQLNQDVPVVQLAVADLAETRDIAAQIEQRVISSAINGE